MVPLTTKDHGFLGAVHDSNALVLLGARFLDPSSGTFVSVDPLLDPLNPAQFNAYVYSGNNPVSWSDPTGLTWRMDDDHPDGGYRLDGAGEKSGSTHGAESTHDESRGAGANSGSGGGGVGVAQAPPPPVLQAPLRALFGPAITGTAIAATDAMSTLGLARQLINGPASGIGLIVAHLNGTDGCGTAANGLIVCGGAMNPGGGGTTIGEVFITDKDTDTVIRSQPALLAHEQRHSAQWAGWGGGVMYALAYGTSSAASQIATGNYWAGNYFEWDADLLGGGYIK